MQLSYKALSKLYENTGNFRSAMYASNSLIAILGPGGIIEGQISEMTEMYERESKLVKSLRHELERQKFLTDYQAMQTLQKQKEIQFKNLELKNQKSKTMKQRILLVFTLICLCFAGMLAHEYDEEKYQEKKHYSDVIGLQKQQITDSISYASRIQKAMFRGEFMKSVFPESFIFNRPKDIVSGDYFYMTAKGEKVYFELLLHRTWSSGCIYQYVGNLVD